MHTYIHACLHTYIRTYIHTYLLTYIHTYILTLGQTLPGAEMSVTAHPPLGQPRRLVPAMLIVLGLGFRHGFGGQLRQVRLIT